MPPREADLTLAAVGDAYLTRRIRPFRDPRFRALVDRVRAADAAVVNLEIPLHDYEGYPTGTATATSARAPPWVADELDWMGFDLFAAATNHSFDYSHGGIAATMAALEERQLAYAGLGENLAAARAPGYVDTPAGRVGLVAACSTITAGSIAGEQRRDMHGRPGISPLRTEPRYVVTAEQLEQLRGISESLGLEARKREGRESALSFLYVGDAAEGEFEFLHVDNENLRFEVGESPGVHRVVNEPDIDAITDEVHRSSRQADWTVASLHAHESADGKSLDHTTPGFVEEFARACIDAGADAFVGHGAHVLQGIEVYDGAPICYDLGNLFIMNQLVERLPAELYERYGLGPEANPVDVFDGRIYDEDGNPRGFLADPGWWESALPVCSWTDGELDAIELYPLDLQVEEPRPRRGRAVMAEGERATEILENLAEYSAPYGTTIEIDGGVGSVVLD